MKVRTYDIINAGPKHRFMVNGSVAHNCGRMIQPQNFPKQSLCGRDVKAAQVHKNILLGITAVKGKYAADIGFDVMKLTSSALRYTIQSAQGNKLVVADLASIEGVSLCYLAGEPWKLRAYQDLFAGTGYGLYEMAYAKSFGIHPTEVTKFQRTIGKVMELALGFQGGVGAFVAFAVIYGIDLDDLADKCYANIPQDVLEEAEGFYDWLNDKDLADAKKGAEKSGRPNEVEAYYSPDRTFSLPKKTFVAVDSLKRLWRGGHPKTAKLWKDADDAFRCAIGAPNKDFWFADGKLRARRSGNWVRIILPSGHNICYPAAKIDEKGTITYKGIGQYSKKWETIYTHGGKIIENATQSFARDIFKFGQLKAEAAGYHVVLPVHDELVCEVPDSPEYSVHELEQIMATQPPWALDLPLAAEGFEDYYYHK